MPTQRDLYEMFSAIQAHEAGCATCQAARAAVEQGLEPELAKLRFCAEGRSRWPGLAEVAQALVTQSYGEEIPT